MPTGYTSFIENGKVKTAKQFLHLCLRNFGVCMRLRDNALELEDDYSEELEKSYQSEIDYHKKNLEIAKKKLKIIREMSDEEVFKRYTSELKKKIKSYKKESVKRAGDYSDYLRIKGVIERWDCDEKFKSIKEFAIDQIDISIPNGNYYEEELKKCGDPTREGFEKNKEEYIASMIESAQWDIDYHAREMERSIKAKNECLEFYRQFTQELEMLNETNDE